MRDNRSLKWGLISMGNCFCAKLLALNSVGHSYSPWHNCPSPVYPSLHEQIWEPSVLLQFELTSQTWLPSLHSLISENKNELPKRCSTETNIKFLSFWGNSFFFLFAKSNAVIIHWHDCPSPRPSVLVQFAVTSQAWLPLRHSSISGSTNDIDIEYFMQSLSVWHLRTSS